mmetsp:Transcript_34687/g.79944  ORF Transcript_34687/g.79944 Transcript_34687/m.79944 type:complete len:300 (+) Transcript_34687:41-940(+)
MESPFRVTASHPGAVAFIGKMTSSNEWAARHLTGNEPTCGRHLRALVPFGIEAFWFGGPSYMAARRAAISAFLHDSPSLRSKRQPGEKMAWDSVPMDAPKPSDGDIVIVTDDQDMAPDGEPGDSGVRQVVPLHPPKPSAIRGLKGEADGPRPVLHPEEDAETGFHVEDDLRPVANEPSEASGYVSTTRPEELNRWPPPPRRDGNADLPAGPVPTMKVFAKHRYAETDEANESWKEQVKNREQAEDKPKLVEAQVQVDRVHLKRQEAEAFNSPAQSEQMYTSPNADNVVPPELRTGLEQR